ncbi:MAG: fibronectin type III domain-containing protein [Kiritimatiellae bacterium]|nr:fibronectin type III domain-containing protein [Kiritimatiellia bacterium]
MPPRKKRAGSTSDVVILIVAVVAIVVLGFLFWKGVDRARRGEEPSRIPADQLPPGTRVVPGAKRPAASPARPLPAGAPRPTVKMDFSKPAPALPAPTAAPPAAVEIPLEMETGALPAALSVPPAPAIPPAAAGGQTARLLPLADTCIQAHLGTSPDRNAGRLGELPVKGNESFVLARYDLSAIRGWTVRRASWRARIRSGQPHTLGFTALRAPWEEGAHTPSEPPSRGATFRWADFNRTPWRADRPPFTHLLRGQPGYLFSVARPVRPSTAEDPWIEVPLNPVLVQALVSGAADSLAVSDEKGQLAGAFAIASREMPDESHFIEVEGAPLDFVPPAAPGSFVAHAHAALSHPKTVGMVLRWTAPGDDGNTGRAFRYDVRFAPAPAAFEKAAAAPPNAAPWPAEPGTAEQMVIEGLKPDTVYTFFLGALDEAGTAGPVTQIVARTAPALALPTVDKPPPFEAGSIEIAGGAAALRILSEFDGLDPGSGAVLDGPPEHAGARPAQTLLWDRGSRTIHLQAAAGETVGFQAMLSRLKEKFPPLSVRSAPFETSAGPALSLVFRFYEAGSAHHPTRRSPLAWHVDEMLPLEGRLDPEKSVLAGRMPDQAHHVVYAELAVPPGAAPGLYRGGLAFSDGKAPEINVLVLLKVLPVSMPAVPRFTVELQAPPILARQHHGKELTSRPQALEIENRYHRLANEHRAVLAVRPYLTQGAAAPWLCPALSGSGTGLAVQGWAAWDAQYAALLSGRLFAASNAPAVPLAHVWLPVFESWPTPLANGLACDDALTARPDGLPVFSGDPRQLEGCLSPGYRAAWAGVLGQYAAHFRERRVDRTAAHVWLVNVPTNTYRGQPPPWSLGQPFFRDDFLALEAYAKMVPPSAAPPVVFRVTVPDAAALAGYGWNPFRLLSVSDRNTAAWELLRRRAASSGARLWIQNDFMPLNETPLATAAGVLRSFLKGADGWAIREATAPAQEPGAGSPQALIRNGRACGLDAPLASLRLKAVRRLQQDIEYLLLLQDRMGWTREQLADFVQAAEPDIGDPYKMTGEHLARLRRAVQGRLEKSE